MSPALYLAAGVILGVCGTIAYAELVEAERRHRERRRRWGNRARAK